MALTSIVGGGTAIQVDTANRQDAIVRRDSSGDDYATTRHASLGLRSSGHLFVGYVAKTANYTAALTETIIDVSASGGARTITLPAAAGVANQVYVYRKSDSSVNTVTIDGDSSETINGLTTWVLYNQFDTVAIVSTGSAWVVLWSTASLAVIAKTASFTVGSQPVPALYVCDATAGAIVPTLPAATAMRGIPLTFKRTDATANTTVTAAGSDAIEGGTTHVLAAQFDAVTLVSDGVDTWHVVSIGP